MSCNRWWARGLAVSAAVALVLTLGCSSEDGETVYANTNWKVGATFDEDTSPLAVEAFSDGAYYIAGIEHPPTDEMFGVVYKYKNESLELAFRSPDNRATFWCIGSTPDSVWAGGYQHLANGVSDPYLVRFDGTAWTEVPPPPIKGTVRACAPVSKNAAWVVTGTNTENAVYYYENGTWRECLASLREASEVELAATADGTVFFFANPLVGPDPASHNILVSRDKGVSWTHEAVDLGNSYRTYGRPVLSARGNTLFVSATFLNKQVTGPDVLTVFQRVGDDTYTSIYSLADTERYHEIGAMAVSGNGDAYAVGRGEGFNRRAGVWTPETFANVGSFGIWDIAAGPSGFCGIGSFFTEDPGEDTGCKVFVNP